MSELVDAINKINYKDESQFNKGDKVKHTKYGEGEVVDIVKTTGNLMYFTTLYLVVKLFKSGLIVKSDEAEWTKIN